MTDESYNLITKSYGNWDQSKFSLKKKGQPGSSSLLIERCRIIMFIPENLFLPSPPIRRNWIQLWLTPLTDVKISSPQLRMKYLSLLHLSTSKVTSDILTTVYDYLFSVPSTFLQEVNLQTYIHYWTLYYRHATRHCCVHNILSLLLYYLHHENQKEIACWQSVP